MSLMETMTCVRHNIPVTAVVFHNRQWGAEKKNQVDFYNRRFVAGELDNQSFADIAKAMGAEGIVVDRLEDVGPALKRAIDLQMNHGKTTIIEVLCTRELGDPFRRDALAKPVRYLDKYKTTSDLAVARYLPIACPSPACGRGLGRGPMHPRSEALWHSERLPSPPAPLPQAGEGRTPRA